MKHFREFINENLVNESTIEKNTADKLAKKIVELAENGAFFAEYDPDENSGEYEGMEYDEYIEKLINIISQSIQNNGKDIEAIWQDTCYDWAANPEGDYPDGFEEEVKENYLKPVLK
jgi:hypothetical protein